MFRLCVYGYACFGVVSGVVSCSVCFDFAWCVLFVDACCVMVVMFCGL